MTRRSPRSASCCLLLTASLLIGCEPEPTPGEAEPLPEGGVHPELARHSAEFEKRVYRVTDGVYQAVGFGLANSILLEGDECVVIVDVMGSVESARAVKSEFDAITKKPIRALIYTHNHADHVFGGTGFIPDGAVEVYAHETTESYIDRIVNVIRPVITVRSARMFGSYLPRQGSDAMVNNGIGPYLEINQEGNTLGLIRPNRTFSDEMELELCGLQLELVHAPGETNDQLFVWLPQKKVLLPGDNIYRAFPNLYTIRGTLYRDVMEWVRSLDKMRARKPEFLAPSHTRPISGAREVEETLTAYRDAIQFVHDQTIRGMNQGLTPEELVESVELPPHLKQHPYLREFYGTVPWSVRSIFNGYLGWFGGDTATLSPADPGARARGFVELAGGQDALLAAAREGLENERYAWAAELASQLLQLDPDDEGARRVKATALRVLGQRSISSNGRNYYLTQARELEGSVFVEAEREFDADVRALVRSIPIRNFLAAMPTYLDPKKSAESDLVVGFRFTDVGEGYTIHVRRGVAEFQATFPENPDVSITTETDVWRELVLRVRNPLTTFASDAVEVEGSILELVRFLRMFSS